jgi:hypothetical protein
MNEFRYDFDWQQSNLYELIALDVLYQKSIESKAIGRCDWSLIYEKSLPECTSYLQMFRHFATERFLRPNCTQKTIFREF